MCCIWHLYQDTSASFLPPAQPPQDRCVKGPGNASDRWLTLMNNSHFRSCNVSRKIHLAGAAATPWIEADSRHNIKATTLVWLPFSLLSIDFQLITAGNTKRLRWVPNKSCLSFFYWGEFNKSSGPGMGICLQREKTKWGCGGGEPVEG